MDELSLILDLYHKQLKLRENPRLRIKYQNEGRILRHIQAFHKYKNFVSGNVLDWGCKYAVDSCLIRNFYGEAVNLYGCDIEDTRHEAFFDFAQLIYTQLKSPKLLPYDDETFDTVVGSGVLEHVVNDRDSLNEIYRILKPSGYFCITFLPNKYSYTEFLSRNVTKKAYHLRIYSLDYIKNELLHHGFQPVSYGYHQLMPTFVSAVNNNGLLDVMSSKIATYNSFLEKIWPIHLFSSNIFIVGQKKLMI